MEPRLAAVVLVLSELFMLCPVKMCYEPGKNYSASIYTVTVSYTHLTLPTKRIV